MYTFPKFTLYFLASLLFIHATNPANSEPDQILEAVWIDGNVSEEAYVSGNWLVGVHFVTDDKDVASRPSLIARLPKEWHGKQACARVTDQAGRYFEFFQIDIPQDWNTRLTRLTYPTRFPKNALPLDHKNSGLAIHSGVCHTDGKEFIPAYWNIEDDSGGSENAPAQIILNMNIGRADEIEAAASIQNDPLPLTCEPVEGTGRISFNHRCRMEIAKAQSGVIELSVTRIRSGNRAPTRNVSVLIAPRS